MCLANCLKFREFEAGCAYKLVAYKKKKTCIRHKLRPGGVAHRLFVKCPVRNGRIFLGSVHQEVSEDRLGFAFDQKWRLSVKSIPVR